MTERVQEILSWYRNDNLGVLTNLHRLMMSGYLAGTGKMVILPVDQGFEHGPLRTFAMNTPAFDPRYHFELALESGCSAYAAPFAQLAVAYDSFLGRIPLIVKMNSSDTLYATKNPDQAITCSVRDALQLGATAIGFTIYPGTSQRKQLFQEIRDMGEEARSVGLPVVIWSYARGEGLGKDDETAVDVICYAAQIACQLGAHIVKVKPPTVHVAQESARKAIESQKLKIDTLKARTELVVKSCFNGRRIVIFSGGEAKSDEAVLKEVSELKDGGAFGSIMGRNAFQRPKSEGIKLLRGVMDIFKH